MKNNNIKDIYKHIMDLSILESEAQILLRDAWEKDDPHRSAVMANLNPKFIRSLYYLLCDTPLRLKMGSLFQSIDSKTPSHHWSNTILRTIFFCYGINPYKVTKDNDLNELVTKIIFEISDCQIKIKRVQKSFVFTDVDKIISILDEAKEYIRVMELIWKYNNSLAIREYPSYLSEASNTDVPRYITDIGLQKIIGGSKGTVTNTIYRDFNDREEVDKSILQDFLLSEYSLLTGNKIGLNNKKASEKIKVIKIKDINEWLLSNDKVLSTNFYDNNQNDIIYDFKENDLDGRPAPRRGELKKDKQTLNNDEETFAIGNVIRESSFLPRSLKKEKLEKELDALLKNDTEKETPSPSDVGGTRVTQDKIRMMVLESYIPHSRTK